MLQAAQTRLEQLRQNMPDAGGLVIATNKETARAYAKILERLSRSPVTVVLSDDSKASEKIANFSGNQDEWMVAVRMVSEGCLLYTSPSPRDVEESRMPSSA